MASLVVTAISHGAAAAVPVDADAGCDFDNDGFDDLAIGVEDKGEVIVLYGSAEGLSKEGRQKWDADRLPKAPPETFYGFGSVTSCGDFNGDGFGDLVVGAVRASFQWVREGAVHIIYGTADGLRRRGHQVLHRGLTPLEGGAPPGTEFGRAIATGDFNGDGFDDLAAGAPGDSVAGTIERAPGSMNIIYGSPSGLDPATDQYFHRVLEGMRGEPQSGADFGGVLATSDFNADGYADIAVGLPRDPIGGDYDQGSVDVLYGSDDGLRVDGNQLWHFGSPGIDIHRDRMHFGHTLTAGDFDADGFGDLAIGLPWLNLWGDTPNLGDVGAVVVIRGSNGGLTGIGSQLIHREVDGYRGNGRDGDWFGARLVAADFGRVGDDLAIGVPYDNVGPVENAGSLQVVYGLAGVGLSTDDQLFHQDSNGFPGSNHDQDSLAINIAAGDYNGDGRDDLAVAILERGNAVSGSGRITVLYSNEATRRLSTSGSQNWNYSNSGGGKRVGGEAFIHIYPHE